MLVKLNVFCRKIHRFLVFFTIISGSIQLVTGLLLKYPKLSQFMSYVDAVNLHSINVTIFAIIFLLQLLTGSYMFIFPHLQHWLEIHPNNSHPPQKSTK